MTIRVDVEKYILKLANEAALKVAKLEIVNTDQGSIAYQRCLYFLSPI